MGYQTLKVELLSFFKKYLNSKILKSIKNIDYCLFLSTNDLKNIRSKYNLNKKNSSKLIFGVDTYFWRVKNIKEDIDVLCVGSDSNRDYEVLKFIPSNIKIKLITSQKLALNIIKI